MSDADNVSRRGFLGATGAAAATVSMTAASYAKVIGANDRIRPMRRVVQVDLNTQHCQMRGQHSRVALHAADHVGGDTIRQKRNSHWPGLLIGVFSLG